jgi:hypothetical protein
MSRRELISVIAGATVWPLVARAQQPERMWRIGFLEPAPASSFAPRVEGLRAGLSFLHASPPPKEPNKSFSNRSSWQGSVSAVRYKNWKMYYTMSQPGPAGWIMPLVPFHFTLVQNIKRDPFEQAVGIDQKTAMSLGGALGAPATGRFTIG